MRLKNGEVCLGWPLSQHILTQGWYYNDGSLHQAIDMRAIVGDTGYGGGRVMCQTITLASPSMVQKLYKQFLQGLPCSII